MAGATILRLRAVLVRGGVAHEDDAWQREVDTDDVDAADDAHEWLETVLCDLDIASATSGDDT